MRLLAAFLGNMVKILVLVLEIEEKRGGCVAPPLVPARCLHARVKHGRFNHSHRHGYPWNADPGPSFWLIADPDPVFSVYKIWKIIDRKILNKKKLFFIACSVIKNWQAHREDNNHAEEQPAFQKMWVSEQTFYYIFLPRSYDYQGHYYIHKPWSIFY